MKYQQLPIDTYLSPVQFIFEMNKALQSLPEYYTGMVVCSDDSGYWLEISGNRSFDHNDLLSISRSLVLVNNLKVKV